MTTSTKADLRAIVRRDPAWNDTTFLPNATLDALLIEGALDLANRGAALPQSATWNAVASTQLYVLGGASPKVTGFLNLYTEAGGLTYTNASGVLKTNPQDFQIVSEAYLDLTFPTWRSDTASDTLQHVYFSYDASGNLCLGVHPASATTTPVFKLWYLSRGTDLTTAVGSDTFYPWTGTATLLTHLEPYMKGIAWYALWQLHETKSYTASLATRWLSLYLANAEEMRKVQTRVFSAKLDGLTAYGKIAPGQTFGQTR